MWTIKELQKWLSKVEAEGAVDLQVILIDNETILGQVQLEAKEASGIIVESIMLLS